MRCRSSTTPAQSRTHTVLSQLRPVWNRFLVSPTSSRVVRYNLLSFNMIIMELAISPVPDMSFPGLHADEDVARDLTLDAAQAARASSGAKKSLSTTQIRKLLDSRNDREVLEGLRRVTSVCYLTARRVPHNDAPSNVAAFGVFTKPLKLCV